MNLNNESEGDGGRSQFYSDAICSAAFGLRVRNPWYEYNDDAWFIELFQLFCCDDWNSIFFEKT